MEEVLVDVLECSVCLNQLDGTARVLPCQHTFCYGCLADITNSHKELRCPECRVLVTIAISELPCNILLMRILESIKNKPLSASLGISTDTTTATPPTTDFSSILNLYNTKNVTASSSTVSTGFPAVGTTSNFPATNLESNNTGFSNQVLNAIAHMTTSSSSSPDAAINTSVTISHSSGQILQSNSILQSTTRDSLQAVSSNPLTYSWSPLPPTNALLCHSSGNIIRNSSQQSNPFLDMSSDNSYLGTSSSLSSSPVPFLQRPNAGSPLLPQFSSLSLSSANLQNAVTTMPQTSTSEALNAVVSPTRLQQHQQSSTAAVPREISVMMQQVHQRVMQNQLTTLHTNMTSSLITDGLCSVSFPSLLLPMSSDTNSIATMGNELQAQVTSTCGQPLLTSSTTSSTTVQSTLTASDATIISATSNSITDSLCTSDQGNSLSSLVSSPTSLISRVPAVASLPRDSSLANPTITTVSLAGDMVRISLNTMQSNCGSTYPAPASKTINNSLGFGGTQSPSHVVAVASMERNLIATSTSVLPFDAHANQTLQRTHFSVPISAVARYNYKGNETKDLSFQKGSVLQLVKAVDTNWYIGELGGRRGFVPASYVQLPATIAQGVALYHFKMGAQAQGPAAHCLTFNKGDMLTVLRRVDHNWAEGCLGNKIGIFPVSFVQLNAAAVTLLEQPTDSASPVIAVQVSAGAPSNSFSTQPVTTTMQPLSRAHASSVSDTPDSKCSSESLNRSIDSSELSRSRANSSGELPPLTIPANTGLPTAGKSNTNNMAMLYVARFSYAPQKADEVALTKGGLYAVTQRCHDGWYKGRCLTTHSTGVFPGNYLYPARSQTIAEYLSRRNSAGATSYPTLASVEHSTAPTTLATLTGVDAVPSPPPACSAVDSTTRLRHLSARRASCGSSVRASSAFVTEESIARGVNRSNSCSTSSFKPTASSSSSFSASVATQAPLTTAATLATASAEESASAESPWQACFTYNAAPGPLLKERYRCVESYPASSPQELNLVAGDIVYVLQRPDASSSSAATDSGSPSSDTSGNLSQGWLYGLVQGTAQQGVFPATFVEPL